MSKANGEISESNSSEAQDPYDLFDFEKTFDICFEELEKRYLKWQQICHPDQFLKESSQTRLMAQKKAAQVNDAYFLLKNDVKRAHYLLTYHQIDSDVCEDKTIHEPQLLMEIMTHREALDGIKEVDELQTFALKINEQLRLCKSTLSNAFDKENFDLAQQQTTRLQYLTKLQQEINQKKKILSSTTSQ